MSTKEIFGFLTVQPDESKKDQKTDPVQTEVQAGNVFFKHVTRRRTIYFWDNNNTGSVPVIRLQPWKMASLMTDDDDTVGHSFIGATAPFTVYPKDPPTANIGTLDYKKFRATGLTTTIASTIIPRVIGSVGALDQLPGVVDTWQEGDGVISINDVPLEYTQIGIVYQHPMVFGGADINTTIGTNYVSFVNAHYLDQVHMESHVHSLLRITTGADAGMYFVRFVDFINNRLYLANLDGSVFVAQATASTLTWYTGPGRRAYFNEVGVIQLSAGTVNTGGTFRPGRARNSFILRVVFDKTGSDATEAGVEKQGSYFVTMRPYTHGEGLYATASAASGYDVGRIRDSMLQLSGGNLPFGPVYWDGGVSSFALDEPNQRLWFCSIGSSNNSAIYYWKWKTAEGFREIQNYLGTGAQKTFVTPQLVLGAADIPIDMKIGPAGIVYTSIYHATAGNAGVAIIKPDLTTLQYTVASAVPFPDSKVDGSALDSTRARVGTAADVSTNGADQVTSASGAFTSSDIGRAVKLTGLGADSGTYKIATIVGGTQITVTTLAGGVVTFTTQTGGTFEIGERLYFFFNNATTGAGKINYMESMNLGPSPAVTFFTRTVTMTNGANCNIYGKRGEKCKVSIDPANGNVYWLSNDTQQQINKYDVSTNTHSFLTIANIQSPAGGTGTIGTITLFTEIHVNSKFDEIWVGTDQGQVKIVKSTFAAATAKRYFGQDNGTYANPAGFLRPSGERTTFVAQYIRAFFELPDGKMYCYLNNAGDAIQPDAIYSRETDLWNFKDDVNAYQGGGFSFVPNLVFDSIGNCLYLLPITKNNANGQVQIGFSAVEVQYQWDNANTKWIPLEVAQSFLPNKNVSDTISPGCRSKPIHAGLEDVLYGVKVGFTKVGGLANNQFLGRAGQATLTLTDGATTEGSTTFTGSGFTSGDVGKLLRLDADFATGTWTLTGNPANTNTVTTGTKTYTFQTALTNVDGNVLIGATASDSLDNLIAAINLGAGSGTLYAAATTANAFVAALATAGDTMKVTALASGTGGNSIATNDTTANGFWGTSATAPSFSLGGTVYRVTAFLTGTTITLKKMDFTNFTPGTTGSRTYTLWDMGSPGANAGPETATVLLADGFGKDNTQDITGITYDTFHFKTILQENVEATKFCVANPLGVPGGQEMKVYYDAFPRVGTAVVASHDPATTQIRALPGAEHSVGGYDGRKLVDGFVDGLMDYSTFGVPASNRGLMHSSPSNDNVWYGTVSSGGFGFLNAVSSNLGNAPMVDLGADAEVGFVIIRGRTRSTQGLLYTLVTHGLKATLYKANGPTAPVASATSRTSGTTNLSLTINNNTITTAGDFLGPITGGGGPFSNGSATAGFSTFTGPAATFIQADVGRVLKITSIGDVGSYRITAVDGTGAIATIRNLDQTAKLWSATASSIVYEIRDGVREEDVLCIPTIASPTQRLCVERVLTATTAQVRIAPHTTAASQSWQCAIPTWDTVKRISYSTEALPPEVKNNGTWITDDGREQFDFQDFKIYADLTNLTVAQRTGRWWHLQTMPRGTNVSSGDYFYSTFEFYSPAGARLGISQNTWTDNSLQNADFMSSHINRMDIIQSAYNAMSGVAGFNGTVDLGGANGDTLTLTTGGNKFLGYQVRRPFTDGVSTAGAGGNFSSATAVFITSDVGRILRIQTGADTGYFRIATRASGTAITVTTPSGSPVTFTGATGATFSIHEGLSIGGVSPDRIVFLDDQTREYSLATINDAMTTLTISEARQVSVVGKQWEIRRPAFDTASGSVDSTKLARLIRPNVSYPVQAGDIAHDSRGALRFWADDIGTGNSRADGSVTGGDGVFVGSGFCSDDVGRLLYITTGVTANKGIWKISVFTNATTVTVVNAYTGAAVVFSADAAADKVYKIFGDRRFKVTKQVTTLRA